MRLLTFSRLRWLLPVLLLALVAADATAGPLSRFRSRRSGGSCVNGTTALGLGLVANACAGGKCNLK